MKDIAVIGIGCRFPGGANNADQFWNLLKDGKDGTSDVPADRWSEDRYYDVNRSMKGKTYTKHGGYISEIDKFDASFFGISPREANYMDPQQRILLEVVNEAIEDAGIKNNQIRGKKVGVYMGAFTVDYKILAFSPYNFEKIDVYSSAGSMMTMISNRISYLYDLKGPSMTIDTACSSSLVATHLACEAIKNGDCDMALVGGVNIMINSPYTIAECKGKFLSPDGLCKTFDESANGYARGEGAGVVVLKPLDKAIADNDYIYSVIKATGSNQDGATDGITVPNREQQEKLLKETCEKAGVSPSDITYMEAHGTGTAVGDPIEANAIGTVVSKGREEKPNCIIGSVKANIGHLEAASGVASLIKASLMMKNKQIPPSLHFKTPNHKIDFEKLRLQVNTKLEPFTSNNGNLIIGINSFGFGGTNASVIMEDYKAADNNINDVKDDDKKLQLIVLTAKTDKALHDASEDLKEFISENINNDDISIEDIAYTLLNKKSHYECRLSFPASSKEDAIEYLTAFINGETRNEMSDENCQYNGEKNKVFVYTGMGPIWWKMGRELLSKEKVFRETVECCDKLIKDYAGWSVIEKLLASEEESELDQPQYAQPANFVLQVALTELWKSYGVEPDAIVGHSVGEVAAAYASGSLDLKQAVKVSIERSRAQQKLINTGAMMAADISEADANKLLKDYKNKVSIGVINSEKSVTLSGDRDCLQEISKILTEKEVFSKMLNVNVAYHSVQMDEIREEFEESVKDIVAKEPNIPIYSTVTGEKSNGDLYGSDYWWKNVRYTVRFKDALNALLDDGYETFIEIGPHPVLKESIKNCMESKEKEGHIIASLIRKKDEQATFYNNLGKMFDLGYNLNLKELVSKQHKFVKLPLYPWQNKSYWNESEESLEFRCGKNNNFMLGNKVKSTVPIWNNEIRFQKYPYLRDHKVQGATLFPGAGYLELGLAFAKQYIPNESCKIENIEFKKAMFLNEDKNTKIQFIFYPDTNRFEIKTRQENEIDWNLNAAGKISKASSNYKKYKLDEEEIKNICHEEVLSEQCYEEFTKKGFEYGEKFRSIQKIYRGKDSVLSYLKITDSDFINDEKYVLHPTIIDACFQGMIAVMSNFENVEDSGQLLLPTNVDSIQVYNKPQENMLSYIKISDFSKKYIKGNIVLFDTLGNLIAEIDGFTVTDSEAQDSQKESNMDMTTYDFTWYSTEDIDKLGYSSEKLDDNEIMSFEESGLWLVFNDSTNTGDKLINELESLNQKVISIVPSEGFSVSEDKNTVYVNPENQDDFTKLVNEVIKVSDYELKGMLHLWNLRAEAVENIEAKAIKDFQTIGCMSIINLLKVFELEQISAPMWIITRGVQNINGLASEKSLLQAPVWGLGKIVGYQEYPSMFGGLIDLNPIPSEEDIRFVINEIQRDDTENLAAIRDGVKYVPRIVKSEIVDSKLKREFKANKSYVITGAFGALGMLVCRWMCKNGARRLILLSRTEIPERSEWKNIDENSSLGKKIKFIKELEYEGINVHPYCVDVSDLEDLEKMKNDFYNEGWPEIAGVIHCAGVIKDKLISNMDKETFDLVLKPKICGSWNLHKVFEQENLDFMVLFSSVASTINVTMGQANYASANMFMDMLARYRQSKGLNTISINWGPWAEIGMASENNLDEYFQSKGIKCILPYQGIKILNDALEYKNPQVVVLGAEWNKVKKLFLSDHVPAMLKYLCLDNDEEKDEDVNKINTSVYEDIMNSTDPNEKKSLIRGAVLNIIANSFGSNTDEISTSKLLGELGMDSLMATDIRRNLELVFKVNISMVELMQGINIEQLAEKINEKLNNIEQNTISTNDIQNITVEAESDNMYEPFPITDVQMAYLTGRDESFMLGGVSTHMYIEMKSNVDIERFNDAFNKVIEKHHMLRTIFLPEGKQQILKEIPKYNILCKDISNCSEEQVNDEILKLREKLSHTVFDPTKWPLFKIEALKISNTSVRLFIGFDMLITDGTSWKKIGDELAKAYYEPEDFDEVCNLTFKDYMRGYTKIKESDTYKRDKEYWLSKIGDFPTSAKIDLKTPLDKIKKPHFTRLRTIFEDSEWEKLKSISKLNGVSTSALLCTAYAMVLSSWSNQDRLAINVTVFNRYPFNPDVEKLIGDFTSLILIDIDLSKHNSFLDNVKEVQNSINKALEHKQFDGVEFIRELGKRNGNKEFLMPAVFTSMISGGGKVIDGWKQIGEIDYTLSQTPQVYLDNQIIEINGKLNVVLDYVDNVFYPHQIESMYSQYIKILKELIDDIEVEEVGISDLDSNIIDIYNDTDASIDNNTTLQQLFVNKAKAIPEKIAVKCNDRVITYGELDKKSDCVAAYLMENGVCANENVGVIGVRCIETIINILGIIKAGATYIPMDPEWPENRKEYVVNNSNCKLIINPDLFKENDLSRYENVTVKLNNDENAAAYVIYTSGSTGKPKGVVITHKAVVNTILDINSKYDVSVSDRIIGISSMSFDLSVYDIFGSLLSGATLVMVDNVRDVNKMIEIVEKEDITIWNTVPSIMNMLIDNMNNDVIDDMSYWEIGSESEVNVDLKENISLRLVLLSGDWIPLDLYEKINEKFIEAEVVSLGGATEASIWSIYYPIKGIEDEWTSIPYGRPLANQKIYILNNKLEMCPVNVQGEICIGGVGVAKEYANDLEKTQAAFINHPKLGRIYKTGDYGILREQGYVEFLGRKDSQVKIKGNRIEIGEIEYCLRKLDYIDNAVVVDLLDKNNSKYLCAYVVSKSELNIEQIKQDLSKELAKYMIPLRYVRINEIPLSSNGKVDRKLLPAVEECEMVERYIAPRNDVERKLQEICNNILDSDTPISIDTNLYSIGWDSIKFISLVAKVKSTFRVDIPFAILVGRPTIEDISKFIINMDAKEEKLYTVLNESRKNNIFAFPPVLTFGIAYKEIAELMNDYKVYAFDYIKDDNIINLYVDKVIEIQPEGEYNLLGYSGGGSIAFEVAKELEKRNYKVNNIILLDTNYGLSDHVSKMDENFEREFKNDVIGIVKKKLFNDIQDKDGLFSNLEIRIENYLDTLIEKCSAEGKVNANLYYVSADKTVNDYRKKLRDTDYKWEYATNGHFYAYEGKGTHNEMIFGEFAEINGNIINSIIEKF